MKLQRNVSANINKNNNKGPSWENEKLFEKTIKLQNELNNLNQKYYLIKIENEHQKDEILRHKKVLDEYNINKEEKEKKKENLFKQITFNRTLKTKKSKNKNNNFNSENDEPKKIKKYKMSNETLINNLKNHCNLLSKNNKELDEKILNLKRNKKNSEVNEFLIEKQVFEDEINRMKKNLEIANNRIENYKNGLEKDYNNLLIEKKKKDRKIIVLKSEIKRSNEIGNDKKKELFNEIQKRNKIIKLLQNKLQKQQKNKEKTTIKAENKEQIKQIKENEKNEEEKIEEKIEEKNNQPLFEKFPEFYHFYIEMIKRNIKTPKVFTMGIIKPLSDIIPTDKNKIIYCEGLCKLFNVHDKNDKKYIIDVANKYFIPNQSLKDFKSNQINVINGIFNEKKMLNYVILVKLKKN